MIRARARASGAPPTLRATWTKTVVTLVAVIAGVGVLAFGATQYQRSLFSHSTSELEDTTQTMIVLERSIVEIVEPMVGILYRFGGQDEERLAQAWTDYREQRAGIDHAFDAAADALDTSAGRTRLSQARQAWEVVDAGVLASRDERSNEELFAILSTGDDPYAASVYEPLDEVDRDLIAVRQATVIDLQDRVAEADRTQQLIALVVGVALVVAVALALYAARRMSRQVLVPLAEVGRGARAMHDSDDAAVLAVPGAVAEVQELASTLNDTAASLRTHHALLRTQAHTDAMTSLPNRHAFTKGLHDLLDDPARGRVAVLFVDLDDFKDVNDTLGHGAGDELLRVVALRLSAATRGCEIAARLGGDEFAVALDAGHDQAAPVRVAERVRVAISSPVGIDGHQVDVGCSIGIAVSEPDTSSGDADELLGNADFAMYMAKSQGKGRHELYSPGMHTEMLARTELSRDLTKALERNEFVLDYQPVLDLPSQRLLGFEALIRWQHPDRGLLAPDEFIGLAEDSGAIVGIGAWVLDQACATLARHHTHDPGLTIGVNVSPRQLLDPDYADGVMRTIVDHGIAPDRVVLEITEATAMTNTQAGAAALVSLRDQGVHIALDDFGTGFSSLRYLGDLPVDVIKIDRSFVAGRSKDHESMLESIVGLAQRLGLSVIAEGVEEPGDLERLRRFGDIAAQGYLLARPMCEGDAMDYVRAHAAVRV